MVRIEIQSFIARSKSIIFTIIFMSSIFWKSGNIFLIFGCGSIDSVGEGERNRDWLAENYWARRPCQVELYNLLYAQIYFIRFNGPSYSILPIFKRVSRQTELVNYPYFVAAGALQRLPRSQLATRLFQHRCRLLSPLTQLYVDSVICGPTSVHFTIKISYAFIHYRVLLSSD